MTAKYFQICSEGEPILFALEAHKLVGLLQARSSLGTPSILPGALLLSILSQKLQSFQSPLPYPSRGVDCYVLSVFNWLLNVGPPNIMTIAKKTKFKSKFTIANFKRQKVNYKRPTVHNQLIPVKGNLFCTKDSSDATLGAVSIFFHRDRSDSAVTYSLVPIVTEWISGGAQTKIIIE